MEDNHPKDRWDKLAVISKPLGAVLAAILIGTIGYFGNQYLKKRQGNEMKTRLYTELISNREQAESALRKDMFKSIIGSFLTADTTTMEAKVLNLELLVYNFHESLNLQPLFLHLTRQLKHEEPTDSLDYMRRIKDVAEETKKKQIAVLEGAGESQHITIPLKNIDTASHKIWQGCLDMGSESESTARQFRLKVEKIHEGHDAIDLRLEVWPPKKSCPEGYVAEDTTDAQNTEVHSSGSKSWETNSVKDTFALKEAGAPSDSTGKPLREVEAKFTVGYFDFPMIDNMRLTNDQRCAIVLKGKDEENQTFELLLLYFPGSHASLKAKPYFHEIMRKLLGPSES